MKLPMYKFVTKRGLRFTAEVCGWDDMDDYMLRNWSRRKLPYKYNTPNIEDIVRCMLAEVNNIGETREYALWGMLMSHVFVTDITDDWTRVMEAGVKQATGGWDTYAKRHTGGICYLSVEMQDHPDCIENEDDKDPDFIMVPFAKDAKDVEMAS